MRPRARPTIVAYDSWEVLDGMMYVVIVGSGKCTRHRLELPKPNENKIEEVVAIIGPRGHTEHRWGPGCAGERGCSAREGTHEGSMADRGAPKGGG